jgi:hypothetical protein
LPLQNRVDPFGDIKAVEWRGMFTGNRGVIHDPDTRTLLRRRWSTKAWIICSCEYKGRRREPMGRNARSGNAGWTELFFLDEVTALAAGHRPCFDCRREAAKEFARHYGEAFGVAKPRVVEIDARLHVERLASRRTPAALEAAEPAQLPDGAMIAIDGQAHALKSGRLWPWSFRGYGTPVPIGTLGSAAIRLITPPTSIAVLKAGYRPIWHPTIQADGR